MGRKKTNPIWLASKEEFARIVAKAKSQKEVLACFGCQNKGNAHNVLKKRMKEEGVDDSHLDKNWSRVADISRRRRRSWQDVLVRDSTYNRFHLKKRLIDSGRLKNKCSECGQEPMWNGKPLVMVLDHINGVNNDNRIENLRLLCPHCNSQQPTFAGRNCRRRPT